MNLTIQSQNLSFPGSEGVRAIEKKQVAFSDHGHVQSITRLLSEKLDSRCFSQLSTAERYLWELSLWQQRISLAWVLKAQTKKLFDADGIFGTSPYRKLKTHGDRLNLKFELCYELFEAFRLNLRKVGAYSDFSELFRQVTIDEFNASLGFHKDIGLRDIVQERRRFVGELRKFQNPYPANSVWGHNHNFFNLCHTVTSRKKNDSNPVRQLRSQFRRKYQDYVEAETKLTQDLDKKGNFRVAFPTLSRCFFSRFGLSE